MTATLSPQIPKNYVNADSRELFFNEKFEQDAIDEYYEREKIKICDAKGSCHTNLFFGFFFDGTRNNYKLAEKTHEQSNVARLYDIFPGNGAPDVLPDVEWKFRPESFTHFFKVYIPGVASPFPQVNDSGVGWMKTLGGATGHKGGDRIVWALVQAINNVNRYFHGRPLISSEEATSLSNRIILSRASRSVMTQRSTPKRDSQNGTLVDARIEFEKLLRRLHSSVSQHWTKDGRTPSKSNPGIVWVRIEGKG